MTTMDKVMIDSTKLGTNSEMDPTAQIKSDEPADTNNPKKRNLRQRGGGLYYGVFDMSSDDELELQLTKKVFSPTKTLFTSFYTLI